MKELNNFKKFLNEEEVNEASIMENHIYANLKRIGEELENVRKFEGKNKAIEVVDYAIDYLKILEQRIINKG